MKVELSIKDDKELRNLIKDMIKGQVKSIARESISDIIAKEANAQRVESAINGTIADIRNGVNVRISQIFIQIREDFNKELKKRINFEVNTAIEEIKKSILDDMLKKLKK